MEFYAPQRLFLLLIPAALLVWELARRGRAAAVAHPKIQRAEASARHLKLTPREHGDAAHNAAPAKPPSFFTKIKAARPLLTLGLALGIVALARPQYGEREIPVFEQSREVLIALDLSRSMLAEDIKPTRLIRAKLLISSLLERLAGERVGLVLFSGTAFLQSPLSADYEILREFLPELGPDTLPEGGTNYRALLDTALEAFGDTPATDRFLIVLSDGESTDDTWQHRLDALKKRGIRTIALGIGTAGGAMLPDGSGGYVKDERGAVVLSRLEPATLRQLAESTGGLYRDASTWLDLAALIRETVEQGQRGQFSDTQVQRLIDRYQWALAPALLFLALSFWLEFPAHPRPRELTLHRLAEPRNTGPRSAARISVAALLGLLLFLTTAKAPAQNVGNEVDHAAPELSALGKIVSRLSTKAAAPTGRDWAELARETVTWGQKLQSEQHPVPPGPVRDALRATRLGEALDPQTADWPALRRELEALLATPPEQEQEQPQQQPPQNPDAQNDSQEQQRQQGSSQDQSPPSDSGSESNDQSSQGSQSPQDAQQGSEQQSAPQPNSSPDSDAPHSGSQQSQQQPPQQAEQPRAGESAFGDMQQDAAQPEPQPSPPAQPPAPQGQTQQVGGTQPKDAAAPDAQDPALSVPLQKLQKIRNDDSPAQLFQMMNDDAPQENSGRPKKDW
ncbi:hypothetical protein AXK11_03355 [Cephaloticoccus primus]|uniref:VWFA domain-containing protein n=1 Tax=Cephaloticoccus primus TaxID=1548207 RepID=A0A139SQW4_9BACT|nr:VWA domain-containing protein [Cephaloticoccus primus]KXU36841.1 hypothetical protein AXK11_03355 [Cephaloticoccus primus]